MKKLLILLAFAPIATQAQKLIGGKNIFKANLSSLAFNNYHFTYERQIAAGGRISLSVSYRFMPKAGLPYQDKLTELINDPSINVGRFQMGNSAITPEVRFYARKGMRGFYIAPYARIANFDLTVPLKYNSTTTVSGIPVQVKKDADFNGKISSFSGGIMFGTQHQIFKKLVLDIWIIGAHYGSSNGNLVGVYNSFQDVNPAVQNAGQAQERQSLQNAIDNLDLSPFKFTGTVTQTNSTTGTANIESTGPWAGVRGVGISLGFRL